MSSNSDLIWLDREIRFDLPLPLLKMFKGEFKKDLLPNIEDTKGNPGEKGFLLISNLRIIWSSNNTSKLNLSIGFDCIISIEIKISYSNRYGNTQSLNIKSKFGSSKYEFIFSTTNPESPKIFTTFQAVCRNYEVSRPYRDLKLRGAIISDKNLTLLAEEKIISRHPNVFNLSSEHTSTPGTLILTTIRLVWFSTSDENFNLSLPLIQIASVKKKATSLILETSKYSGSYILGFKTEELDTISQEVIQIRRLALQKPVLMEEEGRREEGMREGLGREEGRREGGGKEEGGRRREEEENGDRKEEGLEVVESEWNEVRKIGNYLLEGMEGRREVTFCDDLGLAMEKIAENVTAGNLWKIINVVKE